MSETNEKIRSYAQILRRRARYLEERLADAKNTHRANYDGPETEALRMAATAMEREPKLEDSLQELLEELRALTKGASPSMRRAEDLLAVADD